MWNLILETDKLKAKNNIRVIYVLWNLIRNGKQMSRYMAVMLQMSRYMAVMKQMSRYMAVVKQIETKTHR